LREVAPEMQRTIIDEGPVTGRNPNAILISRLRRVQQGLPPGVRDALGLPLSTAVAGTPLLGAPPPPSGAPPELIASVERFILENSLDDNARLILTSAPADVQLAVISEGNLTASRNPAAVLVSRIRRVQEQPGGSSASSQAAAAQAAAVAAQQAAAAAAAQYALAMGQYLPWMGMTDATAGFNMAQPAAPAAAPAVAEPVSSAAGQAQLDLSGFAFPMTTPAAGGEPAGFPFSMTSPAAALPGAPGDPVPQPGMMPGGFSFPGAAPTAAGAAPPAAPQPFLPVPGFSFPTQGFE